MTVLHAADLVTIWTDKGRPARMLWNGIRYRVSDVPTPLYGEPALHDAITHPVIPFLGWRFQATSDIDANDVAVVDVVRIDGQRWQLVAAYR
jgi:hypothetical protein